MNSFKCIVFDWSGTLSDDRELCWDARNRLVAPYGVPSLSLEEFLGYYREPDLVKFYEREHGIRFESFERMSAEYAKALKESSYRASPYSHAAETLTALKRARLRLFVLSAHPRDVLENEARTYGFRDFFEANGVIGSVWDKTDSLKRLVAENSLEASETLFVGDVVLDVRAGKAAGMRTCACAYGYHPRAWLEKEKPDFLISEVSELLDVVGMANK